MSFNPDKTEIMLFSNTEIPELPFSLNDKNIPVSKSHKHLGVPLSVDAKWNQHVDNIVTSRTNLEKLYLIYVIPIFEYASEVWDNCGAGNCNRLEQLQLEAARIVTGLPIFASNKSLYSELGWETERRKRKKYKCFIIYKIKILPITYAI